MQSASLVLVANLLSHAEALHPETTAPIWELPASRNLGVDAAALPDLVASAAEREAEFSACLGRG